MTREERDLLALAVAVGLLPDVPPTTAPTPDPGLGFDVETGCYVRTAA